MSTTNGNMKSLKVTDKDGNVYVLAPVDTEARQAIDEAKNLQFDDDFFTSEVSQDQTTVSVGLNGVPIGIDTDSPLKFVQDNEQGIVFGSDAPFSTALAPEYDPTATYADGDHCMHLGKYFRCNTAIPTAEAWNPAHWAETDIIGDLATVATTGSYTDLSNTPASTLDQGYLRTYDGHSVYAARTDCDKNGAKLTLGINGNVDVLLDENNEPVLDENGDEVISNNSTAMVSTIGGVPLMAATSAIPYVEKTASATITMENNAFNKIVGTPPATMTLACSAPPEQAVSFVAQVTAGNTDSTIVVQVNGQSTLYNKAAGYTLEANKTYQISCLNNCWTMAAFEVPV